MPVSGAMDRWAMGAANGMVGNPADAAVLEWALTAGRLHFDRDARVAMCGPGVQTAMTVRAGEELALSRPVQGRFHYLAIAGGVDTPSLLGSRSTYAMAGLGRALKTGDGIPTGSLTTGAERAPVNRPAYESGVVRVIEGPQRALFADAEWGRFLGAPWKVARASDRMGYRLESDAPLRAPVADLPSEATCVGAVQVPPDGMPIVLMADGPTVGGYPKIAVVITADLPVLVQRLPGDSLQFQGCALVEAQRALRGP